MSPSSTARARLIHRLLDWSLTLCMLILAQAVTIQRIASIFAIATLGLALTLDLTLVFLAHKEKSRRAVLVAAPVANASDDKRGSTQIQSQPASIWCSLAIPVACFVLAGLWAATFGLQVWSAFEAWKWGMTDDEYGRALMSISAQCVFVAMHCALSIGTGVLCINERKEALAALG